jgi:hypothetical protein
MVKTCLESQVSFSFILFLSTSSLSVTSLACPCISTTMDILHRGYHSNPSSNHMNLQPPLNRGTVECSASFHRHPQPVHSFAQPGRVPPNLSVPSSLGSQRRSLFSVLVLAVSLIESSLSRAKVHPSSTTRSFIRSTWSRPTKSVHAFVSGLSTSLPLFRPRSGGFAN